jgi:hypothetical protein
VTKFTLPEAVFAQFGLNFRPWARMARLEEIAGDFAKRLLWFEAVEDARTLVPKLNSTGLPPGEDRIKGKFD